MSVCVSVTLSLCDSVTLWPINPQLSQLSAGGLGQMECYATHLSLWRAAIYCGTLWVPLPLSRPFSLSFLLFCTRFGLACLFGWMFDSTRRSRGMAIRPTNKGKLNQRGCNLIRKREEKRAGRGRGTHIVPQFIMFQLSPSSNIKEGVEEFSTPSFMLF